MQDIEIVRARNAEEREQVAGRAVATLAAGGLIVHPTETVYGIGGDASAENNALIARVKRREPDQPLLVLVPGLDSLRAVFPCVEWPEQAETVAEWCWPGPLTVVVRCAGLPVGLEGPGGGLAVRISPDPTVAVILERWGRPITSTSANLQSQAPARTLQQALAVFAGRDDLCDVDRPVLAIDAGPTKGSTPSTVLSFVESPPAVLREGPVSREQLAALLPDLK